MTAPTLADWRTLPPGPALNALVATRFFGLTLVHRVGVPFADDELRPFSDPTCPAFVLPAGVALDACPADDLAPLPDYSGDIGAAWPVLEQAPAVFRAAAWRLTCGVYDPSPEWLAFVRALPRDLSHLTAREAADRICRAALTGVEATR